MKYFTKIQTEETFEIFKAPHLIVLGILLMAVIALFLFKNKINENQNLSNKMRKILAIWLIIMQFLYTGWKCFIGEYQLSEILPLHLCSITIYLCIYSLLSRDKRVNGIIYFTGFCGALQALLTPSMNGYNFPHFRFFEYFTSHSLIIIAIVFLIVVKEVKINAREFVKTVIALQIFAVIGIVANVLTGGNYMFLAGKPDSASVMDMLADWPYYILQLELIGIVFLALFSIPYMIKYKKDFWVLRSKVEK